MSKLAATADDSSEDRRRFLRATGRVAFFNLVIVGAGAIAGLLLATVMPSKTRGAYAGIQSWFGIALVLGELGLTSSLTYHTARYPGQWKAYLKSTQRLLWACGTVAVVLGLSLTPVLARGSVSTGIAYACMFLAVPANMIFGTYVFVLQSQNLKAWNRARVVQPVLYLVLVLIVVALRQRQLIVAVAILIVTTTVQGFLSRRLLKQKGIPSSSIADISGDRDRRRSLLRYGFASLLGSGPALINNRLDQLILSLVSPFADLGQYAIAVSISNLALPAVVALGQVALPRLAGSRLDGIGPIVKPTMLLAPAMAALVGVVGWLISLVAVPSLLGKSYSGVPHLVLLLLPGTVGLAAGSALGDVLRGLGRPAQAGIAQGIGAVLTVVGLVILVPLLDAEGAAIVSSVAYCAVWIAETLLIMRIIRARGRLNVN